MVIERIKSLSKSKKVILFIGEIFLYWLWLRGIKRLWLSLGTEVSKYLGSDIVTEVSKDLGSDIVIEVSKGLGLDLGHMIYTQLISN